MLDNQSHWRPVVVVSRQLSARYGRDVSITHCTPFNILLHASVYSDTKWPMSINITITWLTDLLTNTPQDGVDAVESQSRAETFEWARMSSVAVQPPQHGFHIDGTLLQLLISHKQNINTSLLLLYDLQ